MDLLESNEILIPTKVQALRKDKLSQPEENAGISDNVCHLMCSAASKT